MDVLYHYDAKDHITCPNSVFETLVQMLGKLSTMNLTQKLFNKTEMEVFQSLTSCFIKICIQFSVE